MVPLLWMQANLSPGDSQALTGGPLKDSAQRRSPLLCCLPLPPPQPKSKGPETFSRHFPKFTSLYTAPPTHRFSQLYSRKICQINFAAAAPPTVCFVCRGQAGKLGKCDPQVELLPSTGTRNALPANSGAHAQPQNVESSGESSEASNQEQLDGEVRD